MLGAWAQWFPSHKWQKENCEPAKFHAWQREQFRQGTEYAANFAELYVNGVLSFNAGGDAIMSVNDILENGISWSTVLAAMPLLRTAGGSITARIGQRDIATTPQTIQALANLSTERQTKVVAEINKAKSLQEASRLLTVLACFAAGTPIVAEEGEIAELVPDSAIDDQHPDDQGDDEGWNLPLLGISIIAFAGAAVSSRRTHRKRREERLADSRLVR
jgi:hypothetical protein